jgi:hypothetical protein
MIMQSQNVNFAPRHTKQNTTEISETKVEGIENLTLNINLHYALSRRPLTEEARVRIRISHL